MKTKAQLKLEEKIALINKVIKVLRKDYIEDKCQGYLPGCPNCDYQVARGWLWHYQLLLESELDDLNKKK